ncbi:MAG: ATP synthase F0 subunit C [Bacteroidales bacterium]|jgi:F-type H+-transporting ATPase subunit c|nr:ATP synthase F0 subunit C [Bacteroidales bacterium]MCK9448685.1 ATP synthase F0 subunit C [Bacteroidales bacterium]MDD3702222.1 ATP synthase F0 subunit C [Bacteroidales bacterium]MDY0368904.1 ATP synthase F0 subunit C [Bacteroidales bacterium]
MDLLSILLQAGMDLMPVAKMVAALAASIAVLGASRGISAIGRSSVESIARQPEAAGDIRSSMIVSAALIEGVAFFAIVLCLLIVFM